MTLGDSLSASRPFASYSDRGEYIDRYIAEYRTVLLGGGLGTFLGHRLPERMRETVLHGLGLVTLIVGVQLTLETKNILIRHGQHFGGGDLGRMVAH